MSNKWCYCICSASPHSLSSIVFSLFFSIGHISAKWNEFHARIGVRLSLEPFHSFWQFVIRGEKNPFVSQCVYYCAKHSALLGQICWTFIWKHTSIVGPEVIILKEKKSYMKYWSVFNKINVQQMVLLYR